MKEQRSVDLGDPELDTIPPVQTVVIGGAGRGGVAASFRVATAGVLRTVATQRNMKIHVMAGLMVMIFFAEILNTALEALIDLFVKDFHRLAMLAKDAAAGGVLVMAATTVVVLAEILWMEWSIVENNLDAVARSVRFGVPLVGVEGVGLFWVRDPRLQVPRLLLSMGLLAPLITHTQDPLFAATAAAFVAMAFVSRVFYTPRA